MQRFEVTTRLCVDPSQLARDTLTMEGVNYELGPLLSMSTPASWHSKPITEWPINQALFTSTIFLLGFIPIDRHQFKFDAIHQFGFHEASKSMINSEWSHERVISPDGLGSIVKDVVIYKSKLGVLGALFTPVYKAIFRHRHRRLRARYSK